MKNIGIWMDKEKAHIISLRGEAEDMVTIYSEIENYHVQGGSGTRVKGGPQDVVQDSRYLERQKHQFKAYFKQIIGYLKDAHTIVIFGPAEAGERFHKELEQHYHTIVRKVDAVIKADSMTDNQTKALVRDYFKKKRPFRVTS